MQDPKQMDRYCKTADEKDHPQNGTGPLANEAKSCYQKEDHRWAASDLRPIRAPSRRALQLKCRCGIVGIRAVRKQLSGGPILYIITGSVVTGALDDGKDSNHQRHQADCQQANRGCDAQGAGSPADRRRGNGNVLGYRTSQFLDRNLPLSVSILSHCTAPEG